MEREFFQIELGCFPEIGDGFFDRMTLTDRSDLGAFCYV